MGWESSGVVRFDFGITRLLLVQEVWDGKPTYMNSWTGNLVVWSDLTLGPSFKIKRG